MTVGRPALRTMSAMPIMRSNTATSSLNLQRKREKQVKFFFCTMGLPWFYTGHAHHALQHCHLLLEPAAQAKKQVNICSKPWVCHGFTLDMPIMRSSTATSSLNLQRKRKNR
jgi:hypothetical protein